MNDHPGISNEELHAFIDGELDPARNAEIATIVGADTHLAERIAAYQSDKKQLEHVYERLDARPLPEQWLRLIAARETQPEAASSARVISSQSSRKISTSTVFFACLIAVRIGAMPASGCTRSFMSTPWRRFSDQHEAVG